MSLTLKVQLQSSKSQKRKLREIEEKVIAEKLKHQHEIDMHLEREKYLQELRQQKLAAKENEKEEKIRKLQEEKRKREIDIFNQRYQKDWSIKGQAEHILQKQQEQIEEKRKHLDSLERKKDEFVANKELKRKRLAERRLLQKSRDIEAAQTRQNILFNQQRNSYIEKELEMEKRLNQFQRK